MILCVCKVLDEGTIFFEGIYTSGNSQMAGLVRPNIQKKIAGRCVDEITYYACKVHEGTVFFEGIYTSGNSRTAALVRQNILKEMADTWVDDEMILCIFQRNLCKVLVRPKQILDIFQRNLYFRELTRSRTGTPEHPKENCRYKRAWYDITYVKYWKLLYFSKESILQGTHERPDWFARTSKRK